MAVYAFRLASLDTIMIRSRGTDDDVITFGVMVNEQARGQCAGRSPAWPGGTTDMALVPATSGSGVWSREFVIGPFDLQPDDTVRVFYSVTNLSDAQIADPDMEKYQIKIMDAMLAAAVGALTGPTGVAVGGVVGEVLAKAFELVPSAAASVLGWKPNGPCNGVVLAGDVALTFGEISRLDYADTGSYLPRLPAFRASPITRHYDDQLTHNIEDCGAVAQTDLTFQILQVDNSVSVRTYAARRGLVAPGITEGLRQLRPETGPVTVRQLVGLRP